MYEYKSGFIISRARSANISYPYNRTKMQTKKDSTERLVNNEPTKKVGDNYYMITIIMLHQLNA